MHAAVRAISATALQRVTNIILKYKLLYISSKKEKSKERTILVKKKQQSTIERCYDHPKAV